MDKNLASEPSRGRYFKKKFHYVQSAMFVRRLVMRCDMREWYFFAHTACDKNFADPRGQLEGLCVIWTAEKEPKTQGAE